MTERRWILVAAGGLLAAACGPAQQAVPQQQAADGQPRHGGTMKEAIEADPYDWDVSVAGKSNPLPRGGGQ